MARKPATQSVSDTQRALEELQKKLADATAIASFTGLAVAEQGDRVLVLQGEGKITITADTPADLDRFKQRMIGANRAPLQLQGAA